MLDTLLKIIAPHPCSGCGNVGSILCDSCKNDIVFESFGRCVRCLSPTTDTHLCSGCRSGGDFDDAWVVGERSGTLKRILDVYKFSSAREARRACAELLDEVLPVLPASIVLCPVPTTSNHRRVRGFDHTDAITRELAAQRKLIVAPLLFKTTSETQHFKTRSDRLSSAGSGLEIRGSVPREILLIDDIYTTGATLAACARALRDAGAEKVYVAIIARQVLDAPADLW